MTFEWRRFCQLSRYTITKDVVRVELPSTRSHRVRVREGDLDWLLEANVTHRGVELDEAQLRVLAWRRNRAVELVGFRLREDGRLVGESRVPKEGTDAGLFRLQLDTLAHECDALEHILTGRDEE